VSGVRRVEVTPYQESWASGYKKEAARLKAIFGEEIIAIHHIGSTSVKGMKAKPIIDLLPVVRSIDRVDMYNEKMIQIGYTPKGENGIAKRRYFQKGGDKRTHHVHMYEEGKFEIDRHLAFRNYLRSHPAAAKEYGDLKEELALRFPFDIKSYIKGKEQKGKEIEKQALAYYGVHSSRF
jgi:GrpB-like predicted nucleotidyltransferase (UPF0157 family)